MSSDACAWKRNLSYGYTLEDGLMDHFCLNLIRFSILSQDGSTSICKEEPVPVNVLKSFEEKKKNYPLCLVCVR